MALTVKVTDIEAVKAALAAWTRPASPPPDLAELRDTKFANGLDVVLDGLALRLAS